MRDDDEQNRFFKKFTVSEAWCLDVLEYTFEVEYKVHSPNMISKALESQ